jgi:hypothetical protein
VRLTGATTATGAATVTYTVGPQAPDATFQYLVRGLSGLNPPGIHTIVVRR